MRWNQCRHPRPGRCRRSPPRHGMCLLGRASGAGADGADVELVDLNALEARSFGGEAAVHLPCATMPQRGTVVLAQCESRVSIGTFERVLAAAMEGCAAVFDIMQASVRERAAAQLAARNGNASIESGF